MDLDGLKYINDTYGHKEGDFAIKSVAEVISASCGPTDICGRLGGDEFVVLGIGGSFAERFQDRFTAKLKELKGKRHDQEGREGRRADGRRQQAGA